MSRSVAAEAAFGRRWLVVGALFLITFSMATPLASYGVFLPILAERFGWSRGAISAALSMNLLVGGVAGFAAGALADRYGPRLILVVTVALARTAFALVSVVDALWQLYLLVGLLGGVGMSSFYLLSATTIARWFDARRGLALALVLVGFNLGYISAGPLAAWLIDVFGWRAAYVLIGSGCGALSMLAALTVRSPREGEVAPGRREGSAARSGPESRVDETGATLAQALADPRQWYLSASWLLQGGLAFMISVHAVPFVRDKGLSLAVASLALTAYGIGSAIGRLAAGAVSDRIGAEATIRVAFVIQIAGLVGLVLWPSPEGRFASIVAFGIGFAAADTMTVKVMPDVFGMRALGAIMGVLALGWRLGAALGPTVAGSLYDMTGSYTLVFGAAPAGVILSWVFFARATSRRRARSPTS
jgi:MFS family permease